MTLAHMEQELANEIGSVIGNALKTRMELRQDTQRRAAERAGISEGWWRQLVNGGAKRGDLWVPAQSTPATYLAMAREVGVEEEVRALLGDLAPAQQASDPWPEGTNLADDDARSFRDTVGRDRHLREDARRHLLNQYELLRRIPATSEPSATTGAERPLRSVARKRTRPRPGDDQ